MQASRQRREEEGTLEGIFGGGLFARYFTVSLTKDNDKRKLCPFKVEADFTKKLAGKPRAISGSCRNGFLVEVASEEQSRAIMSLNEILSPLLSP